MPSFWKKFRGLRCCSHKNDDCTPQRTTIVHSETATPESATHKIFKYSTCTISALLTLFGDFSAGLTILDIANRNCTNQYPSPYAFQSIAACFDYLWNFSTETMIVLILSLVAALHSLLGLAPFNFIQTLNLFRSISHTNLEFCNLLKKVWLLIPTIAIGSTAAGICNTILKILLGEEYYKEHPLYHYIFTILSIFLVGTPVMFCIKNLTKKVVSEWQYLFLNLRYNNQLPPLKNKKQFIGMLQKYLYYKSREFSESEASAVLQELERNATQEDIFLLEKLLSYPTPHISRALSGVKITFEAIILTLCSFGVYPLVDPVQQTFSSFNPTSYTLNVIADSITYPAIILTDLFWYLLNSAKASDIIHQKHSIRDSLPEGCHPGKTLWNGYKNYFPAFVVAMNLTAVIFMNDTLSYTEKLLYSCASFFAHLVMSKDALKGLYISIKPKEQPAFDKFMIKIQDLIDKLERKLENMSIGELYEYIKSISSATSINSDPATEESPLHPNTQQSNSLAKSLIAAGASIWAKATDKETTQTTPSSVYSLV